MFKKLQARGYQVVALFFLAGGSLHAQNSPVPVDTVLAPYYVALYVTDVNQSVQWYSTVFGLQSLGGSSAKDSSWQIVNLGSKQLLIEIIRDHRARRAERPMGFRKVGFRVDDVDVVANRLAETTGERPRIVDFGELGQRILQIRDPDGNTIQLFSPLGKK